MLEQHRDGPPVTIWFIETDRFIITVKQKGCDHMKLGVKNVRGGKRVDNNPHALVCVWRERKKETKDERRSVCT